MTQPTIAPEDEQVLPIVDLGPPVFTGPAHWSDLAAAVGDPGPLAVVLTTFEAGSGTAWHTHAHPQVLVVTLGVGVLEQREGPTKVMRPGEVTIVPAGAVHRHLAGEGGAMTHVSLSVPGDLHLTDALHTHR